MSGLGSLQPYSFLEVYHGVRSHHDRYSEARELLSKLAELYPDHLNGMQLLGDCYMRLQQQGKAEEMYRHVLRQNPNHVTALHNLGQFMQIAMHEHV